MESAEAVSTIQSQADARAAIQSIFASTKCYDLMQHSSKAVVFETSIPFQLAFYALIENDTDVAPIWDAENHAFVALMTISDYVRALLVCFSQNIPMLDLSSRSIADMLYSPLISYQHADFHAVDAEDSIQQMCLQLVRLRADYVPIIDPDACTLIAVLGYLDIVHLLDQAAKQHPNLFFETLEQMRIGTFGDRVITAPKTTLLPDILAAMRDHDISGIPITDEQNRVIGLYHKTDVTFITKATDPDSVLTNLSVFTVNDVLQLRQAQLLTGESPCSMQSLATCNHSDRIDVVLAAMMSSRTTRIVCIDGAGRCLGVISVKDILEYYLGT